MKSYRKKSRRQKLYKMKGCAKTKKNTLAIFCPMCGSKKCSHGMKGGCGCGAPQMGGKRWRRGGDNTLNLGYTGHPIRTIPNPNLAYTGKGGNASNAYPNIVAQPHSQNWVNSQIHRGGASLDTISQLQSSGKYPDGLVGNDWTATPSTWPGVDTANSGNHYPINTYNNDVPNQMINTSAQPPGSVGGRRKHRKSRGKSRRRRGGNPSNSLGQDFINIGRQFTNSLGTTYNALNGYAAPVNPMPWKDQLVNTPNMSNLKY
jgi:hypothetical protein